MEGGRRIQTAAPSFKRFPCLLAPPIDIMWKRPPECLVLPGTEITPDHLGYLYFQFWWIFVGIGVGIDNRDDLCYRDSSIMKQKFFVRKKCSMLPPAMA